MDIVFSINNNESMKVIPVPQEVEIEEPQENGEFDGLKGKLALIGPLGLRRFMLASFFPIRQSKIIRPGADADAWGYVEWFRTCRERSLPMRVVITYDSGYKVNMACLINNFTWHVQQNGDVGYSMEVVEYIFAQARPVEAEPEEEAVEE